MNWPTAAVNTANCDAGLDVPATFRADVLDAIQKLNLIIAAPPRQQAPNFANASCQVAQRSTTVNLATSRAIGQCDNIGMWASAGAVSAGTLTQISTAISGASGYAARAAGVTLTGAAVLSQSIRMEARDAVKYKNNTVSFQVKVDHDVGANVNYTLVVSKPTVADNFTSRTNVATSSATAVPTGTATLLTFQNVALGDVSNGLELEVKAACGAVTAKNFNVTEFMVEPGSIATSWVGKEYEIELRACQRYLPVQDAALNSLAMFGCHGAANSATALVLNVPWKVTPRVPPTSITAASVSNFNVDGDGVVSASPTLISFNACTGQDVGCLTITMSGGMTVGRCYSLRATSTAAKITWNGCEL